ncbi:Sulfide:quinone oxidoreductase, mitochondrial [Aphelenchoides fujianensis]|nr:Sulfide:quinone oxidoreductase, mitochondrial [Aphelenchoides fujianensis]
MKLSSVLWKGPLKDHYKLLIAGGGPGGNAIASHFSRALPGSEIAIIEPNEEHHYQPGYTMLGAGIVNADSLVKNRKDYFPKLVHWYKNSVSEFKPKENAVVMSDGNEVHYDFLVIAVGLQLRFDLVSKRSPELRLQTGLSLQIEGLPEAFDQPGVCSIYRLDLAKKTREELRKFDGGNAVFTFPNTPIKCAGAPQKIMYLADEIFRKNGVRDQSALIYNTTLGKTFGVDKYAKTLDRIMKEKKIIFHGRHNLIKVDADNHLAIFQILDENGKPTDEKATIEYELLHVGPPCSPVKPLRDLAAANDPLTDEKGWVRVSPKTLQSAAYSNVFGLGDCTNTLNGKTVAAISSQYKVVKKNLAAVMDGKKPTHEYDGYASCPLLVDSKHVVLAEFNYEGPLGTLPVDQSKPRFITFLLKRYFMPFLYWNLLLKGYFHGPKPIRKLLHLGFGK